jgi:hypothetical protein
MKRNRIIGIVMNVIVILFMLMDGVMKFIQPKEVVEGTLALGYQLHQIATIGSLGLIATLLFAIPRTAVIGAVLLTGYFGGAIASNFRLDMPLFSHVLFPIYLSILVWGGLLLRFPSLKGLVLNKK